MPRAFVLLGLVGACNEVYGLDNTRLADDELPAVCPPTGTLPELRGDLRQLAVRDCEMFTPSLDARLATAVCHGNVVLGPLEGELEPIEIANIFVDQVRIAPEGDWMIAYAVGFNPNGSVYAIRRDGAMWSGSALFEAADAIEQVGVPSRGPDRRVVYSTYDEIVEMVEDQDGTWTVFARYGMSEAVTNASAPSLSADGLRLVFVHQPIGPNFPSPRVYYADRADRTQPFGIARDLVTVPSGVDFPYLTDDCGRLYFSALDTAFYLKQR